MEFNIAQINIAKMLGAIDSPVMEHFAANLDTINSLADNSKGFVWRWIEDKNHTIPVKVLGDDFIIVNMSVWESIDSLTDFVFKTNHAEFFKRRKEWFEKMPEMHMALWYVPRGHQPTVDEGIYKILQIRKNGETKEAFSFRKKF